MKTTCLLIMDMQVAMFSDASEQPYKGKEVLENIRMLLESARKVNMPVIFIQHTAKNGELLKHTSTWKICDEIGPLCTETVVEKSVRDAFHETTLHEVLQNQSIETLIITGMQTEYCVDTTCRRAVSMGYSCVLIQDAHTTFDSEVLPAETIVKHHNYVLKGVLQLKSTEEAVKQMISPAV